MNIVLDFGQKMLFRLRWLVMSQEQRYALLLKRTKQSHSKQNPSFGYVYLDE
jgi:hypothetical protein